MDNREGLSPEEVTSSRQAFGVNALPAISREPAILRLAGQMVNFFALLLWGGAALALLARMPQLTVAIVAVVVLNAIFAFVQEQRADRAAEQLASMLPSRVTVLRGSVRRQIDAADVVVGDLVCLAPGDRVPADGTCVEVTALHLDVSMLTGESTPIEAEPAGEVFAGSFVTEGDGLARISAVGSSTRLAQLAQLAGRGRDPSTPLARELRRVVHWVTAIALGIAVLFFAVTALLGNPLQDALVFAIGVAVALVPEALLPTITLTLALGAERMARQRVLMRNLDAVETLGSTTIICTDKTGTLTLNQMTVVRAWTPSAEAHVDLPGYAPEAAVRTSPSAGTDSIRALAKAGADCSDGYAFLAEDRWQAHGDPMEAALDVFARRCGINTDALREETGNRIRHPFDPRRRRMSVVVGDRLVVKGAPDSVLRACGEVGDAWHVVESMTTLGLRVLAVAEKRMVSVSSDSLDELESGLSLIGLVGMEDPPRADARTALEGCVRAGIAVIMVTGDHPATATAIAEQVGLRQPGGLVITGAELPSGDAELAAAIRTHGTVIARVSPEDKLRIARSLRRDGQVVAMTGDGVNDVPALHEADIGIAMGKSGSDIAREVADMILLDDHFASILAAIEQGRATYANVRHFLTYHLTDNVAELTPFVVWALSGGSFPLALGVLQVLALDIGTDTLSAVALGSESPAPHALTRPPSKGSLFTRRVMTRAFGVLGPLEAALSMLAFVVTLMSAGWLPGRALPDSTVILAASGAAFITVVLAQAGNAYACRSSRLSVLAMGWRGNLLLPPAIAIGVGLSLAALFVPALSLALGQLPPTWVGWLIAASAPVVLITVDGTEKLLFRRRTQA